MSDFDGLLDHKDSYTEDLHEAMGVESSAASTSSSASTSTPSASTSTMTSTPTPPPIVVPSADKVDERVNMGDPEATEEHVEEAEAIIPIIPKGNEITDARLTLQNKRRAALLSNLPLVGEASPRLEKLYTEMGLFEGIIVATDDFEHHSWVPAQPADRREMRLHLAKLEIDSSWRADNLQRMSKEMTKSMRATFDAIAGSGLTKSYALEMAAANLAKLKAVTKATAFAETRLSEQARLEKHQNGVDLAALMPWVGCRVLTRGWYEQAESQWSHLHVEDLRRKNAQFAEKERRERQEMILPAPGPRQAAPGPRPATRHPPQQGTKKGTPRSYRTAERTSSHREEAHHSRDHDERQGDTQRRRHRTPPHPHATLERSPATFNISKEQLNELLKQQSVTQSMLARATTVEQWSTGATREAMPPASNRRRSRSPPPPPPRREGEDSHERYGR
jgi:hypothetical protein